MTWKKFQETVLPDADQIEVYMAGNMPISAFVTAVHEDAPPILQWDSEDDRNPVSQYVWHGGSRAEQFGLQSHSWEAVSGLSTNPAHWNEKLSHHANSVYFVLAHARESKMAGGALFPEILKSDLHAVRSVIESYSRTAEISGIEEPHACALVEHECEFNGIHGFALHLLVKKLNINWIVGINENHPPVAAG